MIKTNEANEMKTVSSGDEFSKSFPEMENDICKKQPRTCRQGWGVVTETWIRGHADSYLYIIIDYRCYQAEIMTSACCLLYEGGGKVGKAE